MGSKAENANERPRIFEACQPICRKGLEALFADMGLDLVAVSDGTGDVVAEVRQSGAELALLDVDLPGVGVPETLEELILREPRVRVIYGSLVPDVEDLLLALEGGAAGYVALDGPLDELKRDLERARSGDMTVSARFEHLLVDELRERGERSDQKDLTPQQAIIVELIADGLSTAEIADKLTISPLTVKAHYAGINRTLGVSSKAAAVAHAFRRGILS